MLESIIKHCPIREDGLTSREPGRTSAAAQRE